MRLPLRKHERLKIHKDEGPLHLTPTGLQKLKDRLIDLQKNQLPQAIEDVKRTAEFGDFSENAEYQEAKHRLRRIHAQIFQLTEDLKNISIINESEAGGRIQLGSTVVILTHATHKTYLIVGPREADPTKNRISHVSPLGSALMGKQAGEIMTLHTPQGEIKYEIVAVT